MELMYSIFFITTYIGLSASTYFPRYHKHTRNCHHGNYNPSSNLYPRRFPTNFLSPSNLGQRYHQSYPLIPQSVLPVGTLYPGRGMQLPNPLNDRNTYDLPPWESTVPIFNNGRQFPDGDRITFQDPTRDNTNTIGLPPWESSAPVFNNGGPFSDVDKITPLIQTGENIRTNTLDLTPWESSAPVFNNGGPFPDVDNIVPQLSTREITVVLPKPQPVPITPINKNEGLLVNSVPVPVHPKPFPVNPEHVPGKPAPFPVNLVPFPVKPEQIPIIVPIPSYPEPPRVIPGPIPISPVVLTDPLPHPVDIANGANKNDNNNQGIPTSPIPFFPVEVEKGCQETGCSLGNECVFENSVICPTEKNDIPCQCQRGCRVQYTFIPFGSTTIVDTCGSYCSCNSLFGGENCTWINCNKDRPLNTTATAGLVLEPITPETAETADIGPSRGDFPFTVQLGLDPTITDKQKLKFPSQDFVPPIPFLTDNNI